MWIGRSLAPELRKLAAAFPAVVLTGPRQIGKTTLLEHEFAEWRYVSLDSASLAEMAETRPAEFLERHPPPLVIDEAQYAPALFRALKAAIDARRGEPGLFLLTGSQSYALMQSLADSLAGRAAVIPFQSLSAEEWRQSPAAEGRPWTDFWLAGGFPALWSAPRTPIARWYQGYLATYLERDLRNQLRVASLRDFERFLRACAARCAQTLNMAELGRDVGISASTAREWIGALAAGNQIALLEPYHRSLGKRLAKSPKLYFADTGLAAFLMGLAHDAPPPEHLAGSLWENHVVAQWLRWRDWLHPEAALWYWRDAGGNEVDLLVEWQSRLHAIECKYKECPDARDLRGVRRLRAFYDNPDIAGFVACTSPQPYEIAEGIVARSGWTSWTLANA